MKLSNIALIATATLTIVASFTAPAPALATDQRTAVGLCIDRGVKACTWNMDAAGGVDIFVDGHWISCPAGGGDCVLMYRTSGGGKPKVVKGGNVDAVLKAN